MLVPCVPANPEAPGRVPDTSKKENCPESLKSQYRSRPVIAVQPLLLVEKYMCGRITDMWTVTLVLFVLHLSHILEVLTNVAVLKIHQKA